MYDGWKRSGQHTDEWFDKAEAFVEEAFRRFPNPSVAKVPCPCAVCSNTLKRSKREISEHICRHGFKANYFVWVYHGERKRPASEPSPVDFGEGYDEVEVDRFDELRDDVEQAFDISPEEQSEPLAQKFEELLQSAKEPLHERTDVTVLSAVSRLMAVKTKYNLSANCFNDMCKLLDSLLPAGHKMTPNLYESKKLLSVLGMPCERIDYCPKFCMLYRKTDSGLTHCKNCGESRFVLVKGRDGVERQSTVAQKTFRFFPISQRLQRLYMSKSTARQMRWHKEGKRTKEGVMIHPSDGEAWKHFDRQHPEFAAEPRNVRIGLSTDGFTPFNMTSHPYSCWPVFAVPYNLPPGLCLKEEYMFLSVIIPGPKSPGKNLDLFMQPLIEELSDLWTNGILTHDSYKGQNFRMRAAYLWSIHDFPAYGMFSGWSTHGALSCPKCYADTDSFKLKKGGKFSWFDCHRRFLPPNHPFRRENKAFRKGKTIRTKQAPKHLEVDDVIKWHERLARKGYHDEDYGKVHHWTHKCSIYNLPYARDLKQPHNLDLMHQEKNMCEALVNTNWDIQHRTKDNTKARLDCDVICDRPEMNLLENGMKPRAKYCLTRAEVREILVWMKERVKFPDGYATSLRHAVSMEQCKLNGMKAHDYKVFIERLFPAVWRGYVDDSIWRTLSELSFFYRELCAKEISASRMEELEKEIVVIVTKLEKIYVPGFFNCMQHLLVHLPHEAKLGGPAQYRWMYPVERMMKNLRLKVKNKARVEGSIAEAWLTQEIAYFTDKYFATKNKVHVPQPRYKKARRISTSNLDVFNDQAGRSVGKSSTRQLGEEEKLMIQLYVYDNMDEMTVYIE